MSSSSGIKSLQFESDARSESHAGDGHGHGTEADAADTEDTASWIDGSRISEADSTDIEYHSRHLHTRADEDADEDADARPIRGQKARARGSKDESVSTSSTQNQNQIQNQNQKNPARSYVSRAFHHPHAPVDIVRKSTQGVRDDTAELASFALSSFKSYKSFNSNAFSTSTSTFRNTPSSLHSGPGPDRLFSTLSRPEREQEGSLSAYRIQETTEPTTPQSETSSLATPRGKTSFPKIPNDAASPERQEYIPTRDANPDLNGHGHFDEDCPVLENDSEGIDATENTALLLKPQPTTDHPGKTNPNQGDLEAQAGDHTSLVFDLFWQQISKLKAKSRLHFKGEWDKEIKSFPRQVLGVIPAVILGLLLNILDALSYGMILFPLNQPMFAALGPDGISIFYVSCIVSQLVFSCGGSVFKGGVGSEMIEIVPFYHGFVQTIVREIGEDDHQAVLATTLVSFALSAILTGLVFFLMGQCRLGSLIGFFPRHILIGCIGGVGLFLVATGFEVSARLEGSFEYDLATLHTLLSHNKIALWAIPLSLAIALLLLKIRVKHSLTDAAYFISIIIIFYIVEALSSDLTIPKLRHQGWIFEAPQSNVPWHHFYSLYKFRAVDWKALASTLPAMLALTFFGLLHVPINIPALALTLEEDEVDVNRELRAHGISNTLSGLCGSVQNYLVYTNTVLFVRSGGGSRLAGLLLACGTALILVAGPAIIGFIPVMVVGALIFFLGIDLMLEALWTTVGKASRLEYLTILIIVIAMGVWDFVFGIFVGIILACMSFVLQTSQISAIRAKIYGGVANSTVRRHPVQQRFLESAGSQIQVMKLAGFLFFGTIVGVEQQIRALLNDAFLEQPIRFLVLDLYSVDGVDLSAAEAFTRINRLLGVKAVKMVICGFSLESGIGCSLRNAGLFDAEDAPKYFQSLNSALEFSENELLKTFYSAREGIVGEASDAIHIGRIAESLGDSETSPRDPTTNLGSPRQSHLHRVATQTLGEHDLKSSGQEQELGQPLNLILQTFLAVSDQDASFWSQASPYFQRREFSTGEILYEAGDISDAFYLLESGILKARYDLPQGNYSELIVAGTTCGELPFFSATVRTSTTRAEQSSVTWMLSRESWSAMQQDQAAVAQELLKISLKLTKERMDAVTKYMLLTSG